MLVSRISPEPHSSIRRAHATASRPVGLRPPWVYSSPSPGRPGTARASIATTVHWLPNRSAARRTKSESATAAVLIDTLSAPASSRLRISSIVRIPPPTVSGMKTCSAVFRTTSMRMSRFSWDAVISRKTSSSASSRSYRRAISTGSPASRRSTNRTPLTTRPSFTSRHGMIRLASIPRIQGPWTLLPLRLQRLGQADRADHPFVLQRLEPAQVVEGGHAAGGDHRRGDTVREIADGVEIGTHHHPVARDVRVDEAGDAALLDLARELHRDDARHLHPSADRRTAVARVDPRSHLSGVGAGDSRDFLGAAHDRGPQDHPGHARGEVPGRRFEIPHTAAHLDRNARSGGDAADDLRVHRFAE